MWGGVLSAVLSTVAAGIPIMFTSLLKPPLMIPVNGCGKGAGDAGGGNMTIWVSMAMIWSPCFAAGCPMLLPSAATSESIDIDGGPFDGHGPACLYVHGAARFNLGGSRRFDFHVLRIQLDCSLGSRQGYVLMGGDGDGVLRGIDHDA